MRKTFSPFARGVDVNKAIYTRHARALVLDALEDTRVVFLAGARQVGKTTLATEIASQDHPMAKLSLDDQATRDAAGRDPAG